MFASCDGLRTSKTVDGVTTNYYDGSLLIAEQSDTETIIYIYDANGSPVGFQYRESTYPEKTFDTYWYEKNVFGDIVGVYNDAGAKLVTYNYDAWGNFTAGYRNGGANTSVVNNPFRYRGYYYDSDLGFYYLQSRYYDSNTCRFINADCYVSTGQGILGYNMFAYCGNNPVMRVDPTGKFPWFALIVIITCAVIGGFVGNEVANQVEEKRRDEQLEIEQNEEESIVPTDDEYVMPTSERAKYIIVGALVGTAAGGTIVSASGVVGSLIKGSAYDSIKFFGMTGIQTYALGALVRNVVFYGLTPFIDIDESNEEFWEVPEEKYQYNNPYIP